MHPRSRPRPRPPVSRRDSQRHPLRDRLLAATLAVLGGAVSAADAPAPYQEVGRLGIVHYVVVPVDAAKDRAVYDRAIAEVCGAAPTCFMRFFTNSQGAKAALPLPDEIEHEPTVIFQRSDKRGGADFRWSCRLGVITGTCF